MTRSGWHVSLTVKMNELRVRDFCNFKQTLKHLLKLWGLKHCSNPYPYPYPDPHLLRVRKHLLKHLLQQR